MYLAMVALIFPLMVIKDISKIVKMAVFGFVSLAIYIVFIIYLFIENLIVGRGNNLVDTSDPSLGTYWDKYHWFIGDDILESLAVISGNFAMALSTHVVISSIVANNNR